MPHSLSSHPSYSVGEPPQGNRGWSEEGSSDALVLLFCSAIDDVIEGEWRKFVPSSHVELVLKFHPREEQREGSVLPVGRTYSQPRG